jgi:hypothetical protein
LHDTAGANIDLSGDGNEVTLSLTSATVENSTYGSQWMETLSDISDYTVSYSGYFRGGGASSTASKLMLIYGASAANTSFKFSPAGSMPTACATCPNYAGCVNMTGLEVATPTGGMVTLSFSLRARTGSLTCTTGSWAS